MPTLHDEPPAYLSVLYAQRVRRAIREPHLADRFGTARRQAGLWNSRSGRKSSLAWPSSIPNRPQPEPAHCAPYFLYQRLAASRKARLPRVARCVLQRFRKPQPQSTATLILTGVDNIEKPAAAPTRISRFLGFVDETRKLRADGRCGRVRAAVGVRKLQHRHAGSDGKQRTLTCSSSGRCEEVFARSHRAVLSAEVSTTARPRNSSPR